MNICEYGPSGMIKCQEEGVNVYLRPYYGGTYHWYCEEHSKIAELHYKKATIDEYEAWIILSS